MEKYMRDSGSSTQDRPGLRSLLERAEGGLAEIVIADASRFGRYAGTCIEAIDELYAKAIRTHAIGTGRIAETSEEASTSAAPNDEVH